VTETKTRSRAWLRWGPLVGVAAVYLLSITHVMQTSVSDGEHSVTEKRVIRIAHSLSDERVQEAFQALADKYKKIHPDTEVKIQSIPLRAYEQWVTTQLMGGTAPDLIQVLGNSQNWAILAQHYMDALTPYIIDENPYNHGTDLENESWRASYIDGMEGGYFMHLLDFYSIPLTVDNIRVYYNREIFNEVFGSDKPPQDFTEWMSMCEQISAHAEALGELLYPLAVSREDRLLDFYYPTVTANMMRSYDINFAAAHTATQVYLGLLSGDFDLHDERVKAGLELVSEIYSHTQPSFISDMDEQKRFLFLQRRAAMVLGNTRDFGLYRDISDFPVGVFYFPQVGADHPEYGRYYVGPARESPNTTFSFGLSQSSRNREAALDFMKFCTSRQNNAAFCAALDWYPAIKDAPMREELRIFEPRSQGVIYYPNFYSWFGPVQLYFEQFFPLYLDGQIDVDAFISGQEEAYLANYRDSLQLQLDISLRNRHRTEYNGAKAKAAMLFKEAGRLEVGKVVGSRTAYQINLEIGPGHDQYINRTRYILRHFGSDQFPFPYFKNDPGVRPNNKRFLKN
jgi:ABC-type glycerol-3-phosphate transport system substrate-binding protein